MLPLVNTPISLTQAPPFTIPVEFSNPANPTKKHAPKSHCAGLSTHLTQVKTATQRESHPPTPTTLVHTPLKPDVTGLQSLRPPSFHSLLSCLLTHLPHTHTSSHHSNTHLLTGSHSQTPTHCYTLLHTCYLLLTHLHELARLARTRGVTPLPAPPVLLHHPPTHRLLCISL